MTNERWQEITDILRDESATGSECAALCGELWDYADELRRKTTVEGKG